MMHDRAFLAAHGVRVLMLGNPAFAMAVKAIYECFTHVKEGGAVEDLADQQASADLLRAVNRTDEFDTGSSGMWRVSAPASVGRVSVCTCPA